MKMKMKVKIVLIVLMGMVFLTNCSTTKVVKNGGSEKYEETLGKSLNSVDVYVDKIYSWINLMPGAEPRFNISGEFKVLKSKNYSIKDMELDLVKIYQKGREVFTIKPTSRTIIDKKKGRMKVMFSTIKGLMLTPELNSKEKVDIKLVFRQDTDLYQYLIKNVPIEKVY